MDGYGYPYPQYSGSPDRYPDRGDGYGEYFGMTPITAPRDLGRSSRQKLRSRAKSKRSRSASASKSRSHSRTRSKSRTRSHTRSKSRSHSRTRSRSRSRSRSKSRSASRSRKDLNLREPSFMDAFRVMYLTPSTSKKSTTKYLATKKRQDRIEELLKSDGFGSKRWLFYPRHQHSEPVITETTSTRENSDQRIKVDAEFFRKYKRSKTIDRDAPIAKLKRWELLFYKKVGFIRAA